MYLTTDGLKKMAALNVAALKSEGTTLNNSITKTAMDNEMNSDQVKRLVETTNQLAYLSELDGSEDRSFEFDVANYDDIIDGMVPVEGMDKAASETLASPLSLVSGSFTKMEKVAAEKEATLEKLGKNEKLQMLKKVASQERRVLDEMLSAEHDNLVKLAQHKAIVSRDQEALLKMASFDNSMEMTKLVYGHDKVASDVHRLWADIELRDVKALSDRLTMCKQAQEDKKILEAKVTEAEGILKEAFLSAAINAAKAVAGKAVGVGKSFSNGSAGRKIKKGYGAFEAVDSTNEIRKGMKKNHDVWSSLRG